RRGAVWRPAVCELLTELSVALTFLVAAVALLVGVSSVDWALTAWLAGLLGVLVLIEFEVGEGNTRPIHLAVVPMLVLLEPGVVPVAVLIAHLPRTLVNILRGRVR